MGACMGSKVNLEQYVHPTKSYADEVSTYYESIATDSTMAVRSKRAMFTEEKNFLLSRNGDVLEAFGELFRRLIGEFQDGRFGINYVLSKDQLKLALERDLDVVLPDKVFDKIFKFFDFRNEGYVDKLEFTVACGLLTYHGSYKSATELSFRIFDSNHDGVISKREFSEMALILMGYRLRTLFSMKGGKTAFYRFLQSEFNDELMLFYNEFNLDSNRHYPRESRRSLRLRDSTSQYISRAKALQLYNEYIAPGAAHEVNISDEIRNAVRVGLDKDNSTNVPISLFEPALFDVFQLMENDCLMRFKRKIVQSHHVLTDVIWEEMGISRNYMSFEEFEEYAYETPNLFQFIDKLYESLTNEMAIAITKKERAESAGSQLKPKLPPKFESYKK